MYLTRNQLNSKEFRGFESHRLRQRQHPAGCGFLFLRQTMQGLQGGIRTARARRFASRRAATVLRTVARARENPTVCAKYHYSILHWVVIFYCRFAKFRCFLIGISPLFSSSDFRVRYKSYQQSREIAIHETAQKSLFPFCVALYFAHKNTNHLCRMGSLDFLYHIRYNSIEI